MKENKLPIEETNWKLLIKKESETSNEYGCIPEKRPVKELLNYGIINLNKPSGPTSHQVSDYVKKILKINKAGHSGTLDPKVTGVLPIALGKATRINQILLKTGKEYIALVHLHKEIPESEINKAVKEFTGKIKQIPPIRSAVKRILREREIYYLNILEINNKDVLFKIGCEAGTYIRKIAADFGKSLGIGAHLKELIRTKVGLFNDKSWHSLQDLKDAYEFYKEGNEKEIRKIILPVERAIEHLPKVWVFDNCVDTLCHGANLSIPGVSKLNNFEKDETIAVLTLKNELICLGKSLMNYKEILEKNKGLCIKTKKVFIERNTYPKFVK